MAYWFVDAAARSAWSSATSQQAQLEALAAAFPGNVTLRYYTAAGAHLRTVTHSPLAINTATTPRQSAIGALIADTPVTPGTAAYVIASTAPSGGTDILRADLSPAMTIVTGSRPNLQPQTGAAGLVVQASAGLPVSALPAWRTAMTTLTWAEIPGNTLSAIDPAANAAINPNGTSGAPWAGTGGQTTIVISWNGATWDSSTDTLHLPLQGGHTDYAGNEPYKVCIRNSSATWAMLRNPSGAIGNEITLNDGHEASGFYSDGRLRSAHSYANQCYVPGHGPIITRITAKYSSGTGAWVQKMYLVNETTGEASEWADYTAIAATDTAGGEGAACYDSTRGCIWSLGNGTATMLKTVVSTRVTTTHGSDDNHINDGGGSLRYAPALDLVIALKSYTNTLKIFNPATDTWTTPTVSGSFATGYDNTDSAGGIDWDEANQRLLCWNQATDTTLITILTPGVDPTANWTASTMSVSGSNAVTPSARPGPGMFGRFAYSSFLKGCVLLNGTTQPLYFFATEAL